MSNWDYWEGFVCYIGAICFGSLALYLLLTRSGWLLL